MVEHVLHQHELREMMNGSDVGFAIALHCIGKQQKKSSEVNSWCTKNALRKYKKFVE